MAGLGGALGGRGTAPEADGAAEAGDAPNQFTENARAKKVRLQKEMLEKIHHEINGWFELPTATPDVYVVQKKGSKMVKPFHSNLAPVSSPMLVTVTAPTITACLLAGSHN